MGMWTPGSGGGGGGGVSSPLDVDNIRIEDNTISSTNANGNITVDPNGTGVVDLQGPAQVTGTIPITTIVAGDEKAQIGGANWNLGSDVHVRWYSDPDVPSGAADVGLKRNAAGVVEITNGTTGSGQLNVGVNTQIKAAQVLVPTGTASEPGLGFSSDPNSGFLSLGNGVIGVTFDGSRTWELRGTRLVLQRTDGFFVLGSDENVGLGWAAAGVAKLCAGTSGLGAARGGQEVVARITDLALTTAESGILYTNTGAGGQVIFTLPAATLTNNVGCCFGFCVRAAQNIRVVAAGADVINLAAAASAGGGRIDSNTVRSMVWLYVSGAGFWDAIENGTWTAT
jgi:hypothetical protein